MSSKRIQEANERKFKPQKKKLKELGKAMLDMGVTWDEVNKYIESSGEKSKPGIAKMIEDSSLTWAEMMMAHQVWDAAIKGDRKAFELVRDTIGEKPSNDVNVNDTTDPIKKLTNEELEERIKILERLGENYNGEE